jgi:hypothetical protein
MTFPGSQRNDRGDPKAARHTSHEALGLRVLAFSFPPTSIFCVKGLIARGVMENALWLEHCAQFW